MHFEILGEHCNWGENLRRKSVICHNYIFKYLKTKKKTKKQNKTKKEGEVKKKKKEEDKRQKKKKKKKKMKGENMGQLMRTGHLRKAEKKRKPKDWPRPINRKFTSRPRKMLCWRKVVVWSGLVCSLCKKQKKWVIAVAVAVAVAVDVNGGK